MHIDVFESGVAQPNYWDAQIHFVDTLYTSTLRYLQPLVPFKVNNIYMSLGIVHECGNTLVDKYFQSKILIIKNNWKVCTTATKLVLLSTS